MQYACTPPYRYRVVNVRVCQYMDVRDRCRTTLHIRSCICESLRDALQYLHRSVLASTKTPPSMFGNAKWGLKVHTRCHLKRTFYTKNAHLLKTYFLCSVWSPSICFTLWFLRPKHLHSHSHMLNTSMLFTRSCALVYSNAMLIINMWRGCALAFSARSDGQSFSSRTRVYSLCV